MSRNDSLADTEEEYEEDTIAEVAEDESSEGSEVVKDSEESSEVVKDSEANGGSEHEPDDATHVIADESHVSDTMRTVEDAAHAVGGNVDIGGVHVMHDSSADAKRSSELLVEESKDIETTQTEKLAGDNGSGNAELKQLRVESDATEERVAELREILAERKPRCLLEADIENVIVTKRQCSSRIHSSEKRKAFIVRNWLRTECDDLTVPRVLEALLIQFAAALIDSNILFEQETDDLIQHIFEECVSVDVSNFCLLFRATDDGFSAEAFHGKCDNKGATLTVLLTDFGHVIGGFTTEPWTSGGHDFYKCDTNAWLFVARVNEAWETQLSGTRLPVILRATKDRKDHVYHFPSVGPFFGYYDLLVSNDCNVICSVCDSGTSFDALDSCLMSGGFYLSYSHQSSCFKVVDYEVFACY